MSTILGSESDQVVEVKPPMKRFTFGPRERKATTDVAFLVANISMLVISPGVLMLLAVSVSMGAWYLSVTRS